jgi:TAT (twin-arginine translocation) pathway signal sequence
MSAGARYPVPSRREFLKGAGAAGAGLVAGSISGGEGLAGSARADVRAASPRTYARGGAPASSVDFGRIFPNLPPFAEANDSVRSALLEVGQPGGVLDAQDDLTAGPKARSATSIAARAPV